MIRFLADECVYRLTVEKLRSAGYTVVTALELGLGGSDDAIVLKKAIADQYVLPTGDLDFASIRHYPPSEHLGVIVLRISPSTQEQVHALLLSYLENRTPAQLKNRLVIVSHTKIRTREG